MLTELDSGERVISERLDHVRSVAVGYWIGAGSRDETDAKAGVSHFIEHLLFKGTRRYSALEIAEIFDGLGGELNAATSREHTLVYARVPDNHLETALDVMGDMVFSPLFDDLDTEREVVLEEIAMYEDTPQELVHDLIARSGLRLAPARPPGDRHRRGDLVVSRRALPDYHRGMYTPGNIVVAAAGNIEHDRLVELVERAVDRGDGLTPASRIRSLLASRRSRACASAKETEQYHVCLGAPGISRSDRRRFAASVLDAILGGSASSRLFQEIREKRGMAYSVYSFASQYTDTGQIGMYVGTREDNLGEALAIAVEQTGEIASGGPAARGRTGEGEPEGAQLLAMESTSTQMNRLGTSLVTDTDMLTLERVSAEVDAVEHDASCELAALLLAPGRSRQQGSARTRSGS